MGSPNGWGGYPSEHDDAVAQPALAPGRVLAALGADGADLALVGIPIHRTSLSPTGADRTPMPVRDALRRCNPFVVPDGGGSGSVELGALRFADVGDVDEPDAHHDLRDGVSNGSRSGA